MRPALFSLIQLHLPSSASKLAVVLKHDPHNDVHFTAQPVNDGSNQIQYFSSEFKKEGITYATCPTHSVNESAAGTLPQREINEILTVDADRDATKENSGADGRSDELENTKITNESLQGDTDGKCGDGDDITKGKDGDEGSVKNGEDDIVKSGDEDEDYHDDEDDYGDDDYSDWENPSDKEADETDLSSKSPHNLWQKRSRISSKDELEVVKKGPSQETKDNKTDVKPKRAKSKKSAGDKSTMTAHVNLKDAPEPGAKKVDSSQSNELNELSDSEMRIIKLITRGIHSGTPETEANQCLQIAKKKCQQQNLDLMKLKTAANRLNDGTQTEGGLKVGMVEVQLYMIKTKQKVRLTSWMTDLAGAISNCFSVKYFYNSYNSNKRRRGKSSITFYGIEQNCQLSAFAYVSFFARIHELSVNYDVETSYQSFLNTNDMISDMGIPMLHEDPMMKKGTYTRVSRRSFCEGIVSRMGENVRKEIAKEKTEKETKNKKINELKRRYEIAIRRGEEQTKPYGEELEQIKMELTDLGIEVGDDDFEIDFKKEKEENNLQVALVSEIEKAPAKALENAGVKTRKRRRPQLSNSNPTAYSEGREAGAGFHPAERSVQ